MKQMLLKVAIVALAACVSVKALQHHQCKENGQVALVVDGLSEQHGKDILEEVGDQPATFMLSLSHLENEEVVEMVKKDKKHDFGYRLNPKNDKKLGQISSTKIEAELVRAKEIFISELGRNLKYILLPYTDKPTLSKLTGIAERMGMSAIVHSLYLDTDVDKAKKEIIKRMTDPDHQTHIVLINDHAEHEEVLTFLKEYISKNDFSLVSISDCIHHAVAAASSEEEQVSNKKPNHSKKHKAHDKKTHKKDIKVNLEDVSGYSEEEPKPKKKTQHKKSHPLVHKNDISSDGEKPSHHGKGGALKMKARKNKVADDPDKVAGSKAAKSKKADDKTDTAGKKPEAGQKGENKKEGNAAIPSATISFSSLTAMLIVTVFALL